MKRRDYPPQTIEALHHAFRLLLSSKLNTTQALSRIREEIDRFSQAVGAELCFRPMSYQQFFAKLRLCAGPHHNPFFAYFADRYGCQAR